jgi:hypothetical protein
MANPGAGAEHWSQEVVSQTDEPSDSTFQMDKWPTALGLLGSQATVRHPPTRCLFLTRLPQTGSPCAFPLLSEPDPQAGLCEEDSVRQRQLGHSIPSPTA